VYDPSAKVAGVAEVAGMVWPLILKEARLDFFRAYLRVPGM
jgi:hypothetical protein